MNKTFSGDLLLVIAVICSLSNIVRAVDNDEEDACQPSTAGCTCHKGAMSCSGKTITAFPSVDPTEGITDFSFTGCRFESSLKIPYANATSLILDDCDLTSFADDAFVSLSQLRQLSITENSRLLNLSTLSFANLTSLNKLDLSGNGFTALPSGFLDIFPSLREVDLSRNDWQAFGAVFGKSASRITNLKCEYCLLTTVPKDTLASMTALEELNLNQNNFTTLSENAFPKLGSLKKLSLDTCQLRDINSRAFSNLTALTSLDVGNNLLVQIYPKTFEPFWKTLRVLRLQHNEFQTMIEDRAPWTSLEDLQLGQNPWTCDCVISWMHFLGRIDQENVTCANPESVRGNTIFNTEVNLYCDASLFKPARTAIVLGIAIPVILVCLALIVYYVYQILNNRKRRTRERNSSFKYRSVYGDTVETNSKTNILS